VEEGRLETLVSQKYDIISEEGGYSYPHLVATDTQVLAPYRRCTLTTSKVRLALVFGSIQLVSLPESVN